MNKCTIVPLSSEIEDEEVGEGGTAKVYLVHGWPIILRQFLHQKRSLGLK